jgi:hypothetical protein
MTQQYPGVRVQGGRAPGGPDSTPPPTAAYRASPSLLGWRRGVALLACAAMVGGVVTGGGRSPITRSHPLALTATAVSSGGAPIARAWYGRPGHESTVLAVAMPPLAPGCLSLHPLGDAVYRVVADRAGALSATVSRSTAPTVVWVTGHTLPYADAADHEVMAPYTRGCGHGPAFAVDSVQTVQDWIAALLLALMALPGPHTTPPVRQLSGLSGQLVAAHSPTRSPGGAAAPGRTPTGSAR